METPDETTLTPFLNEKIISSKLKSKNVKNLKINIAILVEVDKERRAEIILKMTSFHNKK